MPLTPEQEAKLAELQEMDPFEQSSGLTPEQEVKLAELQEMDPFDPDKSNPSIMDKIKAGAAGAVMSASFDKADDILAAGRTAFNNKTYEENLAESEQDFKSVKELAPGAYDTAGQAVEAIHPLHNAPTDHLKSSAAGIAMGVSRGTADEALAYGRSLFSDKDYEEELPQAREFFKEAKEENPTIYDLGDFGGGFVGPGALVKSTGVAINTAQAAFEGFTRSEGDLTDRLTSGTLSGVAGGTLSKGLNKYGDVIATKVSNKVNEVGEWVSNKAGKVAGAAETTMDKLNKVWGDLTPEARRSETLYKTRQEAKEKWTNPKIIEKEAEILEELNVKYDLFDGNFATNNKAGKKLLQAKKKVGQDLGNTNKEVTNALNKKQRAEAARAKIDFTKSGGNLANSFELLKENIMSKGTEQLHKRKLMFKAIDAEKVEIVRIMKDSKDSLLGELREIRKGIGKRMRKTDHDPEPFAAAVKLVNKDLYMAIRDLEIKEVARLQKSMGSTGNSKLLDSYVGNMREYTNIMNNVEKFAETVVGKGSGKIEKLKNSTWDRIAQLKDSQVANIMFANAYQKIKGMTPEMAVKNPTAIKVAKKLNIPVGSLIHFLEEEFVRVQEEAER